MMMTNPTMEFKCRKCGGEIIYDDNYDGCFDGSRMYAYWYGHCDACEQSYKWCEVYELESIKNLEEDNN